MSLFDFLKEWTINYVKSRDVIRNTIVEIHKDKEELVVVHKHKEVKYFIDPFLEDIDKNLKLLKEDSDAAIICMNTQENLNKMFEKWKDLAKHRHLAMMFVNPSSKLDKLWVIFPYTHDRIADPSSFKTGIKTMFEQVDEVDRSNVEKVYENS